MFELEGEVYGGLHRIVGHLEWKGTGRYWRPKPQPRTAGGVPVPGVPGPAGHGLPKVPTYLR